MSRMTLLEDITGVTGFESIVVGDDEMDPSAAVQ